LLLLERSKNYIFSMWTKDSGNEIIESIVTSYTEQYSEIKKMLISCLQCRHCSWRKHKSVFPRGEKKPRIWKLVYDNGPCRYVLRARCFCTVAPGTCQPLEKWLKTPVTKLVTNSNVTWMHVNFSYLSNKSWIFSP
jgi:hypothetical protein